METKKMTLAAIQGKLSRAEMKNLMAGDESLPGGDCGLAKYGTAGNCPPGQTAMYCNINGQGICKDENGNCYVIGTATCSID